MPLPREGASPPTMPMTHNAWSKDKATAATVSSLQLPGAVPDIEEETEEEEVPEKKGVFSAGLPSIAELRKKTIPWIHKQGTRLMEKEEGHRAFSELKPEFATARLRSAAAEEFPSENVFRKDCRWTNIISNPWFEKVGLTMIFFNAIWIAVDIDYNSALIILDASVIFILMEIIFGIYFCGELLCRYMAYISTRHAFKDAWFSFDFLLVFIMVAETWLMPLIDIVIEGLAGSGTGFGRSASVLRVLKVLRVLRTARIIRVARYMPELMILIKGLMVAARSVFFTLVLLLLITYIFSITLTQLSRDTSLDAAMYFPKVHIAVLNLILHSVMPDQEGFYREVVAEDWYFGVLYVVFIMVGSLIIMNMLVGVLVEAVQTVASCEHEQIQIDFAKRVLFEMIDAEGADENGDNLISVQEFERLLEKPDAVAALQRLGVDLYAALEYGKLLFEDGQPLTFGELLEGMLMLRGSNQTTVKDLVTLRKFTADEFGHLHTVLAEVVKRMDRGHLPPIPRSKSSPPRALIKGVDEV